MTNTGPSQTSGVASSPPQPDEMEAIFDRLHELEWGFAPLAVIHAAAQTGLLASMAEDDDGLQPPEAIAARAGLHAAATHKILRSLTAMGVCRCQEARFEMVPGARPLFEPGSEVDHTDAIDHIHGLALRWYQDLPAFLREGTWERTRRSPEGAAKFVGAMRSMTHGVAGRLDAVLDLPETGHVLDLGGGLGSWSIELCLRHPGWRATVLDVPEVAPLAEEEIARHDLGDRIQPVAGDYMSSPLPPADLVLLANIIHQEGPRDARALIQRAAGAVSPGGRLVAVDFTLEDDRCSPLLGAIFAVNMRLFGDTYSESEIGGWMKSAGLPEVRRHDLSPHKFAIEGRRPG